MTFFVSILPAYILVSSENMVFNDQHYPEGLVSYLVTRIKARTDHQAMVSTKNMESVCCVLSFSHHHLSG